MIDRQLVCTKERFSIKGRKSWDEDSPTREKMRPCNNWYDRGINYAGLHKYLKGQIGRKWDDVYSDISHNYPNWKEAAKSKWCVQQNVVRFEKGVAYCEALYRRWGPKGKDHRIVGFYVLDGILRYQGREARRGRKRK